MISRTNVDRVESAWRLFYPRIYTMPNDDNKSNGALIYWTNGLISFRYILLFPVCCLFSFWMISYSYDLCIRFINVSMTDETESAFVTCGLEVLLWLVIFTWPFFQNPKKRNSRNWRKHNILSHFKCLGQQQYSYRFSLLCLLCTNKGKTCLLGVFFKSCYKGLKVTYMTEHLKLHFCVTKG